MPRNDAPDVELAQAIARLAASRAARRAREALEVEPHTQPSRELPDYSGGWCDDCERDPCACEPTHPQIVIERGAHAVIHVNNEKGDAMTEPGDKIEGAADRALEAIKIVDNPIRLIALGLLLAAALGAFALYLIFG